MRHTATLAVLLAAACAGRTPAPTQTPAVGSDYVSPLVGYDAELSTYAYPEPVVFHAFDSQRQPLRMAYLDVQPAAPNGRVVLLLHGKNFNASYWAPTARALAARGFRVIAPDQVGFGKSSKPDEYQFGFAQLAANTRGLLSSLGIHRCVVVGHSMGGMLAARYALAFPDDVQRLVLVDPIGLEDYLAAGVPYRTPDEAYEAELQATPDSLRDYERRSYFGGEWKPEFEALLEPQLGWMKNPDRPRVAWCAALTTEMILAQPVVHDLPRIAVPTLLVVGAKDRAAVGGAWAAKPVAARLGDVPALARKAAAAIPGARLVEMPDVGHLPHVEAFDAWMKELTGFLDAPVR